MHPQAEEGRRVYGTDLFIGPPLERALLCRILAAIFGVEARDIVCRDEADCPSGPDVEHWAAYGLRDVIRLHALPEAGNLRWKADLEFVEPISIGRMQGLAEDCRGAVALSRDTAFPDEIGTAAGEGYVIFRPGCLPAAGAVHGTETDPDRDLVYDWRLTGEPMRGLPLG